ncbi:MAG: GNAT family N-acetyltransferase [Myxococcaceae bacterium]
MFEAKPDAELVARVTQRFPMLALRNAELGKQLTEKSLVAEVRDDGSAVICTPGRWRMLVGTAGTEEALGKLILDLRAVSEAMVGDDAVFKLPDEAVARLGFRRVVRERFVQDLTKVPATEPEHDGIEYVQCEGKWVKPSLELLGRTHAFNVEGVYTTLPKEPTPAECERVFASSLKSDRLVPEAAVAAVENGQVLGVVYCSIEEEVPTLMGLAVDPVTRGRGLSRGLVRRTQAGLKRAGHERMAFFTTDRNLPVHKLFTPEEILETEEFVAWFSIKNRETGQWPT